MTLLWSQIVRLGAEWAPRDSEEHIHPDELENRRGRFELSSKHINRLADSIRQHGYSPERHGQLGLNETDLGENVYHHASGTETDPSDHEHHEHLLYALKDVGHGPVPVHIHEQTSNQHGHAPILYHGTTAEDLEEVQPNHSATGNFGQAVHEPGYAYATGRDSAESYADTAAMTYGGRPRVYRVAPLGPIEKDPTYDKAGNHRANHHDDVRSRHGFQVHDEEDLGHDDDYEDEWGDHNDEDEGEH